MICLKNQIAVVLMVLVGSFSRASLSAEMPESESPASRIVLEGDYPGHLQDVWMNGDGIWWAHTQFLLKTDRDGRILRKAEVGGHHAGLEIRDGRLFTAVCAFNGEPRHATTPACHVMIGEYDAESLERIEMHVLDINDRAGSLCFLPDGTLLVGCLRHPALKPTEVKFHHLDRDFRLLKTHIIDVGLPVKLGIEVIRREGDDLLLFIYGAPVVRLDARTLTVKDRLQCTGGQMGYARQGDRAWVGFSKQDPQTKRYASGLALKDLPTEPFSSHPWLLGGESDFAAIRKRMKSDPTMAAAMKGISARARMYDGVAPMERTMDGRRLLKTSREALARISFCAMDARINDNATSRATAIRTMKEVVAFSDWNPSHFLDVAEMSMAVSLGYDWLYHDLSEEDRRTISGGLKRLGLDEMCCEARAPKSKLRAKTNWGQVCSAGALAVAFALWDEYEPQSRGLVKAAVSGLRRPMAVYAPKGGYPEGPGYWNYGTSFNVIALALLEHARGTDDGLSQLDGFLATGDFLDWTTGPTGRMFNYSDSGLDRQVATATWWFAAHGLPTCVDAFERAAVLAAAEHPENLPRAFPCALFWMLKAPKAEPAERPRIWTSDDPTGIVTMRTDWTTNAWFAAFKGGLVGANHGHLDVGSFIFEADGVRWAGDIGSEGYGRIEAGGLSLWNMTQTSDRWKLYRLNNESHNVLRPDGVLQNVRSSGRVVSAQDTGAALEAAFDLDAIYAPALASWKRQARLASDSFEVTDEVTTGTSESVVWGFSTQAEAMVSGETVILSAKGRTLSVSVSGAEGAVWQVGPAAGTHPLDSPNTSWTRVSLVLPRAAHHRFTVRFAPSATPAPCLPEEFGVAQAVADSGTTAMALALEGARLYAGCGGSLIVYDVTRPFEPQRLGSVDGFGAVRQIAVQNGFAYVACRESGLWIVDATNPRAPRIRSRFDCCELATGVDVAGDVCFLGQRQNGVEFIDIRDPDRPEHIAMRKTDESQSVKYRNGFLYSGDWGTGHVTVFDCRDLRDIREVAHEPLWGYGDGVWLKGDRLYCETGHHVRNRDLATLSYRPIMTDEMRTYGLANAGAGCGHGLDVFDVTDPARPKRLGRVDFPPLYTRGNDMWTPRTTSGSDMVYCCATHNGVFAVDCGDPANPKVVDRWLAPDPKQPNLPSACVGSIAVGDGCLYVALKTGGVQVVPAVHAKHETFEQGVLPQHAEHREDYPTDADEFAVYRPTSRGQVRAVAVRDDLVYAACGSAGLHVLRIGDDDAIEKVGEWPGEVVDVQVEGDRLYAAEGRRGWGVYAIDGPASLRELKRLPCLDEKGDPALCIWKPSPEWVVVSTRRSEAKFFRTEEFAADGRARIGVGQCPGWDKYLMDRVLDGRIAYNSAHRCVAWVDLRDPQKPTIARSDPKNNLGLADGICRLNEHQALATRGNGYFLMEPGVCDPPSGGRWSVTPFPDPRVRGIPRASADGRIVLVTCRIARQASLLDFTDPSTPVLLRHWKLSGNPDLGAFCRGRAVIPCGYQGVLVQRRRKR